MFLESLKMAVQRVRTDLGLVVFFLEVNICGVHALLSKGSVGGYTW